MFKDISNLFDKRKKALSSGQSKSSQIKENLTEFIKIKFGGNLSGISIKIEYNSKDNYLTITTGNKVLANEFTYILADLVEFFKSKKIKLDRILIR